MIIVTPQEWELNSCRIYFIWYDLIIFQSCDCNDDVGTIPIFCTFERLYIRILGDKQSKKTRVLYTVYSGKEKPQNSDPSKTSFKNSITYHV